MKRLKVIGTEKEIDWLLKTLANGCLGCPYLEECNRQAKVDATQTEEPHQISCSEYLKGKLEIHIVE